MIPTRNWQSGYVVLLSLLLTACAPFSNQVADSPDRNASPVTTVATPEQQAAERVVALSSLAADILFQLDSAKLVGIPDSRLFNQQPGFQDIPVVSQGRTPPNLEKIVALKPDLVVGTAGFHDRTLADLQRLGIPTLATQVDSWEGLQDLTRTLATAVGADPAPLLQRYQTFLPAAPGTEQPSALVLVSRQPILSPNKESWAGDLLAKFGATNLAAELQGQSPVGGYITLSPEKILEANPELLLVVSREANLLEELQAQPFWSQLQAVRNNRVYEFDYYGLVNPGSLGAIETTSKELQRAFKMTGKP